MEMRKVELHTKPTNSKQNSRPFFFSLFLPEIQGNQTLMKVNQFSTARIDLLKSYIFFFKIKRQCNDVVDKPLAAIVEQFIRCNLFYRWQTSIRKFDGLLDARDRKIKC